MRLLISFARNYPLSTILMLLSLLLAGLIEGIGLSMLLPIIGITIGNPTGAEPVPAAENGTAGSMLEQMVADAYKCELENLSSSDASAFIRQLQQAA